MRGMGGLVVGRGYFEGELSDQSFDQKLGDLDVRDQGDREVDSESTSAVSLTGVGCRTTVVVLGREVYVHVDHMVRQMLG